MTLYSPRSRNELIKWIFIVISRKIVKEFYTAKFYTILVDETTDVSAKQQLVSCSRHVKEDIFVQERFLLFEDVYDVTGKTIFNSIKRLLSKNSLEITYMVGQVMDGAAAMSGSQSGAQKFISDDVTTAIYEHSVSHSLNLCQEKASQVPKYRYVLQPCANW